MSVLQVSISDKDSERAEMFLKSFGNQAKGAVRKSLNRAITGVKMDAAREAGKAYNVKPADVKKTFSNSKASGNRLKATATFSGKRTPLYRFGAKPARPTKRRPKVGVSVQVKASRKVVRGAFVAKMKSGHVSLFKRSGAHRLPLRELEGPAVPQMLNNQGVREKLQGSAADRFSKNLDHEMNYLIQKGGK